MRRARRFKAVCNGTAALFLLLGLSRLVSAGLILIDPVYASAQARCIDATCALSTDPVRLLPANDRKEAWLTPGTEERLLERMASPSGRWLLFTASAMLALPIFILFLGLAAAMRSFAVDGFGRVAVRWLKRSALAALVWTLLRPIAHSVQSVALMPPVTRFDQIPLYISVGDIFWGVLVAGSAWIAMRAMEEALTIRSELEAYV